MRKWGLLIGLVVVCPVSAAAQPLQLGPPKQLDCSGEVVQAPTAGNVTFPCAADATKTCVHAPVGLPATCAAACVAEAEAICAQQPQDASKGTFARGLTEATLALAPSASWQSMAIAGLSNFVAKRAEAELYNWIASHLTGKLCALEYVAGKKWFPRTCAYLQDDQYKAQLASPLLITAVRDDVEGLPEAAAAFIASKDANLAVLAMVAPTLRSIVQRLRHGGHPFAIVAELGDDAGLQSACNPGGAELACALIGLGELTGMLAALVDEDTGHIDVVALRHFLWERIVEGEWPRRAAAAFGGSVPAWLEPYVDPAKTTDVHRDRLLKLVRALRALEQHLESLNAAPPTTRDAALAAAATTLELFTAAIDAGVEVRDDAATTTNWKRARLVMLAMAYGLRGDYRAAIFAIVELSGDAEIPLPVDARRFLAFVAEIAGAESPDEVEAALDRVAAPVGSWRIKREKKLWSVTAFAGVLGGYEILRDDEEAVADAVERGASAGFFAPVGLAYTWPCRKSSYGVFFSLLDLGQLTWTRLESRATDDGDTVAAAAETDFTQVFSPGLYVHAGFGDSPFTLGAGVSYAPALRQYFAGGGTGEPALLDTIRAGVFVAVDVTILPL